MPHFSSLPKRSSHLAQAYHVLFEAHDGLLEQITAQRALLVLLATKAPEVLVRRAWIVGWIESADIYLCALANLCTSMGAPVPQRTLAQVPAWPIADLPPLLVDQVGMYRALQAGEGQAHRLVAPSRVEHWAARAVRSVLTRRLDAQDWSRFNYRVATFEGGLLKRIDENRELVNELASQAPDLLKQHRQVIETLEALDRFLGRVHGIMPPARRRTPPGFPRQWPEITSGTTGSRPC